LRRLFELILIHGLVNHPDISRTRQGVTIQLRIRFAPLELKKRKPRIKKKVKFFDPGFEEFCK
jgi:hypothetical protein